MKAPGSSTRPLSARDRGDAPYDDAFASRPRNSLHNPAAADPGAYLRGLAGISWSSIPPGSGVTPAQRLAAQADICAQATAQADEICFQPLRATLDTEQYSGPDFRMTIQQDTGNVRMILARWPILSVISIEISPNSFPRQWTSLSAGQWDIEFPPIGVYGSVAPSASGGDGGQSIIFAPSASWIYGRNGFVARVTYVNGWPHAGLAANAVPVESGAQAISVDDCTGWALTSEMTGATGAAGTVFDSGAQETIQVTAASAASGPGTLTLASPLFFPHSAGVIVSALPASVQWGVILLAAQQALTRGATATTVQSVPGTASNANTGGGAGLNTRDLIGQAKRILAPFRRSI
jgi:hypothetical protein